MKKKINLLLVCSLILFNLSFSACSSDDDDETTPLQIDEPGKITGLGNTAGELTGKAYELPSELELQGEIKGYSGSYSAFSNTQPLDKKASLKNLPLVTKTNQVDTVMGSGYYVKLHISIKNLSDREIEYSFPAGLIVKSVSGRYQHGVLLKKVTLKYAANETKNVALLMYCGNASKSSSSPYETYEWGVVSNSSLIVDLCNRLKNKMINYEEKPVSYDSQTGDLQNILWKLTDYKDALSEANIEYINNLPESN